MVAKLVIRAGKALELLTCLACAAAPAGRRGRPPSATAADCMRGAGTPFRSTEWGGGSVRLL